MAATTSAVPLPISARASQSRLPGGSDGGHARSWLRTCAQPGATQEIAPGVEYQRVVMRRLKTPLRRAELVLGVDMAVAPGTFVSVTWYPMDSSEEPKFAMYRV